MIDQIASQLGRATSLNAGICITTSDAPSDDELVDWAVRHGYTWQRSAVDDIVTRLVGVARMTDADVVVRIWGDCPFICPELIDAMAERHTSLGLDFLCNSNLDEDRFPGGMDIEIYSRDLLEKMDAAVMHDKLREFPVEYVRRSADVTSACFPFEEDWSHLHLTVDYPEDILAARELLSVFEAAGEYPTFSGIRQLFRERPELFSGFSTLARNIEYTLFRQENAEP
jgi:spore coat polysaccharide biosynthesis protein SpsF (cytidylyltransferase family)